MREEMTHERCSELLLPYAQGSLERAAADRVEQHLAGCDECARELDGLRGLRMELPVAELTDLERKRLRTGVRAGLEGLQEIPQPSDGWRRRAAPLLAAAATLAIVAVGLVVWSGSGTDSPMSTAGRDESVENLEGGGGDTDTDTFGAEAESDQAQGGAAQGAAGGEPAPEAAKIQAPAADSAAGSVGRQQDAQTEEVAGTLAFGAAPVITEQPYSTARFDPSSLIPPRFPGPGADLETYLNRITRAVEDASVTALIRTCTAQTNVSRPDPWFPTSATYYRADEILVIGFVQPVRSSRILRYELRGWHRDCEHPAPIYRSGRLS